MAEPERLDPKLLARLREALGSEWTIQTLDRRQPNWISDLDETGAWVQTERSKERGTGDQHVPAWMIQTAWDHLVRHGSLTNDQLLKGLEVKRSSFVRALLARLPEVEIVEDPPPTTLRLSTPGGAPRPDDKR